jgi:hypothetical protein
VRLLLLALGAVAIAQQEEQQDGEGDVGPDIFWSNDVVDHLIMCGKEPVCMSTVGGAILRLIGVFLPKYIAKQWPFGNG